MSSKEGWWSEGPVEPSKKGVSQVIWIFEFLSVFFWMRSVGCLEMKLSKGTELEKKQDNQPLSSSRVSEIPSHGFRDRYWGWPPCASTKDARLQMFDFLQPWKKPCVEFCRLTVLQRSPSRFCFNFEKNSLQERDTFIERDRVIVMMDSNVSIDCKYALPLLCAISGLHSSRHSGSPFCLWGSFLSLEWSQDYSIIMLFFLMLIGLSCSSMTRSMALDLTLQLGPFFEKDQISQKTSGL